MGGKTKKGQKMQDQMTHAESVSKIAELAEENSQLRHTMVELLEILRQWEPHHSSGEDRQKIVQAMYLVGILKAPIFGADMVTPNE
ncbi:MAG: hypothetical protein Q8K46_01730 [Deltaproteobacteria bacterium]|nr:hypothetical protein [Deltaproteobacteria bacterium]